jgi:hypothetical protein
MNTTRFRTRRQVKVLLCTVALAATSACRTASKASPSLEIKDIRSSTFQGGEDHQDKALAEACASWQLTKAQAQQFFQLSTPYKESPYSEFYQLPCSIEGVVEAEGKTWDFNINAGATAVWSRGAEVRYFGCSAPACEPLVLLMPDGMNP